MRISYPSSVLQLLILLIIIPCNIILPDVRFVSKTGTSQYPYSSWETASDSIQKCLNICNSGDTIFVGNGTYKEQVFMIPGISLIGSGMDSCIIDTRNFNPINDNVRVEDSCKLSGFSIIGGFEYGATVTCDGNKGEIYLNKISGCGFGITIGNSSIHIYKNIITGFNSAGIVLSSISFNFYPIIENNLILPPQPSNTMGINISINSRPTIRNNILYLNGELARGYVGGGSDSTWIYNNLVMGNKLSIGFENSLVPTFEYNNVVIGVTAAEGAGFIAATRTILKNNIAINCTRGFVKYPEIKIVQYNNSWNNSIADYYGFTPDSTNLSVDPMFVNDTSDFHLQMFSPLIDRGDPNILDKDGTRSDIGLYGGPFGESHNYKDLSPRPPRGLILMKDSNYVTIKWNKNTEADFNYYNLYRDTVSGFTINDKTFVSSLTDSFYRHIIQSGVTKYYYKLTASDNQGNVSKESEELGINLTSVNDKLQVLSDYRLFQNYPNPFNPSTIIPYRLKEGGYVKLTIYDIKGEQVAVLVNQTQEAGYYEVEFMGKNSAKGKTLVDRIASGIYLYRLDVKNENNIPVYSDMKKMVFLK